MNTLYNPDKETIINTVTGEVIRLYCGNELDRIGEIVAMVAFDSTQAQKAYVLLTKLIHGDN